MFSETTCDKDTSFNRIMICGKPMHTSTFDLNQGTDLEIEESH